MHNNFRSDFEMIPVNKIGRTGWEYKPATWPQNVDPAVHKLLESKTQSPILYIRKRWRDNLVQNCKIYKDNGDLYMNPGDDCIYKIKKVTINNREPDQSVVDNDNVPHELKCLICLDNKRTHMVTECNHVVACVNCAVDIMKMNPKKCPLCNTLIKSWKKYIFNKNIFPIILFIYK